MLVEGTVALAAVEGALGGEGEQGGEGVGMEEAEGVQRHRRSATSATRSVFSFSFLQCNFISRNLGLPAHIVADVRLVTLPAAVPLEAVLEREHAPGPGWGRGRGGELRLASRASSVER